MTTPATPTAGDVSPGIVAAAVIPTPVPLGASSISHNEKLLPTIPALHIPALHAFAYNGTVYLMVVAPAAATPGQAVSLDTKSPLQVPPDLLVHPLDITIATYNAGGTPKTTAPTA